MTPKEKAQEIVNKYILYTEKYVDGWIESDLYSAKFCALIAVDELIDSFNSIYDDCISNTKKYSGAKYGMLNYWQEVKQEIEKL
jgi:hypothetical protein